MTRSFFEPFSIWDRKKIRSLLSQEIEWAQKNSATPVALKALSFLLYRLGDVKDAPLIWQAKTANDDCFISLDPEFVVGGGPENTINYLKQYPHELQNLTTLLIDKKECTLIGYIQNLLKKDGFAGGFFRRDPSYIKDTETYLCETMDEALQDD